MKPTNLKGLLVFIALMVFTYSIKAQTWEEIGFNLPDGDHVSYRSKITFANKDTGWLYTEFDKGNAHLKKLYRTTNGGKSWQSVTPNNIAIDLGLVFFSMEPDFFYMVCDNNGAFNAVFTNDGGNT
jgi:photosystem II stability/assembly factor-like uncharacterized protein